MKNAVRRNRSASRAKLPQQVFMSYGQADRQKARQLTAAIRAAGCRVWDAAEEVSPGDNFALAIGKALESCDAMVVLVSPEAMKSSNVSLEVGFALGSNNYAHRVIPVQIKETPGAPWILKKFQYVPWGPHAAESVVKRLKGMEIDSPEAA